MVFGLDLQRCVGDAVLIGEQLASLIEHRMRVGADRDHEVGCGHLHFGGQRPDMDVVNVHVWTLTSEMEVATAHLMVSVGTDSHAVLDQARQLLADQHGITHATLQVEPEDHQGCDEVNW